MIDWLFPLHYYQQFQLYCGNNSCFSAKHAALRRKSEDWLAKHQDNVSEWGDMSICGLLFQWAITIQIQLNVLV
jgi:hypothetical protein